MHENNQHAVIDYNNLVYHIADTYNKTERCKVIGVEVCLAEQLLSLLCGLHDGVISC